jgi:hypothetical protein
MQKPANPCEVHPIPPLSTIVLSEAIASMT